MNEISPQEPAPRKSRRTFSGAFKAQVVMEALEGSRDLQTIADAYGLHPNQIKNWKCILRKRIGEVFEDQRRQVLRRRPPDEKYPGRIPYSPCKLPSAISARESPDSRPPA